MNATTAPTRIEKLPDNFLASELEGELILVHGKSGAFFALKDTGLAIWHALDAERDLARICELLAKEYEIDRRVCEIEVERFIGQLVEAGFARYA